MSNYLLDQTQQEYYNGNDFGGYQFVSLDDIIEQFMFVYVGEDKIIPKISRTQVAFHAQRAMQELSFDTFKSCKAQEITVPPSLQMILPQDYVNYTKISWVDGSGIKHLLYPTSKTSNPPNPFQNDDGDFILNVIGDLDSTSNSVVLDKEYHNIKVGMIVTGPYVPTPAMVGSTINDGTATTITLVSSINPIPTIVSMVLPDQTNTNTTLTITNSNGSLIQEESLSHPVDNLTWNLLDYKLTALSVADISSVEVGMLVSHMNIPQGTTVTNVSGTTIVISNTPTVAEASGAEVSFISTEYSSDTWDSYQTNTPSENSNNDYNIDDDIYDDNIGQRYGLDPQHTQVNGSFYIDCTGGKIHFSSNVSGKTVILDYISDSLGTDGETQVHKFAEEAMYKWITHAVLASKAKTPEYLVARFKKERFAAIRNAKLRLSNIKLEEITQILRGKSKQIKH
jgi:hypothetical protein